MSKVIQFPCNRRPNAGHTEDAVIIIMPVVRVERAPMLPDDSPKRKRSRKPRCLRLVQASGDR